MAHVLDHGAALAIGIAAVALTGPAWAAADYYLKLGDIKGEVTSSAARDGHKDWIELSSLSFAEDRAATGGVRVAGDGLPTGRRQHEPVTISKNLETSRSGAAPSSAGPGKVAAPDTAQPAGLLVPAVQKVREATARMHKWRDCAVGQHIPDVTLREGTSGRTARVLDATVTECGAEQVSFNFSKIEWN